MEKINPHPDKNLKHPTVGDLLDYIEKNKVPREATILIEHLNDWYLEEGKRSHERCVNDFGDGYDKFNYVGNGFGGNKNSNNFIIWMHW